MKITAIYVITDDIPKAMGIREDIQAETDNAEVVTVAVTAARFFCGRIENSRKFLKEHGCIPDMLSESRLNRRIHETDPSVWLNMFRIFSEILKGTDSGQEYIADSYPVPVCQNIRISRPKIYKGEEYRGFIPSRRLYFYGLRVHMIVTGSGEPVGFLPAPGAGSDVTVFKQSDFDLPENSICYGDKA